MARRAVEGAPRIDLGIGSPAKVCMAGGKTYGGCRPAQHPGAIMMPVGTQPAADSGQLGRESCEQDQSSSYDFRPILLARCRFFSLLLRLFAPVAFYTTCRGNSAPASRPWPAAQLVRASRLGRPARLRPRANDPAPHNRQTLAPCDAM